MPNIKIMSKFLPARQAQQKIYISTIPRYFNFTQEKRFDRNISDENGGFTSSPILNNCCFVLFFLEFCVQIQNCLVDFVKTAQLCSAQTLA